MFFTVIPIQFRFNSDPGPPLRQIRTGSLEFACCGANLRPDAGSGKQQRDAIAAFLGVDALFDEVSQ